MPLRKRGIEADTHYTGLFGQEGGEGLTKACTVNTAAY